MAKLVTFTSEVLRRTRSPVQCLLELQVTYDGQHPSIELCRKTPFLRCRQEEKARRQSPLNAVRRWVWKSEVPSLDHPTSSPQILSKVRRHSSEEASPSTHWSIVSDSDTTTVKRSYIPIPHPEQVKYRAEPVKPNASRIPFFVSNPGIIYSVTTGVIQSHRVSPVSYRF